MVCLGAPRHCYRFAHMAATCYCRLACDLTCMMVGTFCFPGLNDLNKGRCRYCVITWKKSTWSWWTHVGAWDCFPTKHRQSGTLQQEQENHVCACTNEVFICLHTVVVWGVDSWKAWFCYTHADIVFPTKFGFLLSTTNFLLEHKMQHTSWVPNQKHKSSYTNLWRWWKPNKQTSFQQCDYVYKNHH